MVEGNNENNRKCHLVISPALVSYIIKTLWLTVQRNLLTAIVLVEKTSPAIMSSFLVSIYLKTRLTWPLRTKNYRDNLSSSRATDTKLKLWPREMFHRRIKF